MKKGLSKEQMEEIRNLAAMPDEDIDLTDIPEVEDWSNAVVGKFYRPMKQSVTMRLDADVISWLKEDGRGYQTRANSLLRAAMERQRKKRQLKGGSAPKKKQTGY